MTYGFIKLECLSLESLSNNREIICKHDSRWQTLSLLKANKFYSLQKTINVSKTQQLRRETGAAT